MARTDRGRCARHSLLDQVKAPRTSPAGGAASGASTTVVCPPVTRRDPGPNPGLGAIRSAVGRVLALEASRRGFDSRGRKEEKFDDESTRVKEGSIPSGLRPAGREQPARRDVSWRPAW